MENKEKIEKDSIITKEATKMNRRYFLKLAGGSAGLLLATSALSLSLGESAHASVVLLQTPLPGKNVPQFVEDLPHFATRVIGGSPTQLRVSGDNLTVTMEEFQQKALPASVYAALPAPYNTGTYVWGYKIADGSSVSGPFWPGFTVLASRGTPKIMQYVNNLPTSGSEVQKRVTIDQTLHWADPLGLGMPPMQPMLQCPIGALPPTGPDNTNKWCFPYSGPPPAVVHLHGGEVPSDYDGGPDQWFTPNGLRGKGYRSKSVTSGNSAIYEYINEQEPATLWFHDHTLGATRVNVYGGLAAFYFLQDPTVERTDLPGGSGDTATVLDYSTLVSGTPVPMKAEIEIAIQDRMFDTNGQLFFPDIGLNPEHPFWIPEFFGDTMIVNGKSWPVMKVEPRRYRFRFLDGCNARFLHMYLWNFVTATLGPAFWQIGTEQGLMDAPVMINPFDPVTPSYLVLAPGERADIIIDFSGFAGQTLTLANNAKAPYPKGAPADPKTTGKIMQFIVQPSLSDPAGDTSYNPALGGSPRLTTMNKLVNFTAGTLAAGVTVQKRRILTLNEVMGMGGPLEVLVNNTKWSGKRMLADGSHVSIPDSTVDVLGNALTELPKVGDMEIWEIVNLTADAHPIHLHLVQFQLLNRQPFNVSQYNKAYAALFPGGYDPVMMMTVPAGVFIPAFGPPKPYNSWPLPAGVPPVIGGNPDPTKFLQQTARPPDPSERGWKDTVKAFPGEVTRIAVRFTKQNGSPYGFDSTGTTQIAYDKYNNLAPGPGYVWHCHIVDHEDNEMMRPYHPVV